MYHYTDFKRDLPAILSTGAPVGWDLPIFLADDYESRIMLAAVALKAGYYIAEREGLENDKYKHGSSRIVPSSEK